MPLLVLPVRGGKCVEQFDYVTHTARDRVHIRFRSGLPITGLDRLVAWFQLGVAVS